MDSQVVAGHTPTDTLIVVSFRLPSSSYCTVAKSFYCFYESLRVAICQTQGDGTLLLEPPVDCY